ncbi:MAG: YifB family Mg chelatase-like AAA ATPase [Defluviitaleaceae bacterium]|nr:YifB family Mg chelatase-like AAA ATPase [Defluviitaleaceae bacterium]
MITKIISGGVVGIYGYDVFVEVFISNGLPAFDIVGLAGKAIKESKERVRAAIKNCGFEFPSKKITINLAPADVRKEGPYFDLPIAIGILVSIGVIKESKVSNVFFAGELSLDGQIRNINGVLPMVHHSSKKYKTFIVPKENLKEAQLIQNIEIIGVKHLNEVIEYFRTGTKPKDYNKNFENESCRSDNITYKEDFTDNENIKLDFANVKGQEGMKRALTVAAAGYHNALIIGPPGSGKTMLAKRLPFILPDLSLEESLTTTKIYSIAGRLKNRNKLIKERPFRDPHHAISYAALIGGGKVIKPGEISLSHNGVLFLDELPEFKRSVLEVLRQPLEDREIQISHADESVTYPAKFMLIAAMNPCPCGNYGTGTDECKCSIMAISKYIGKISGPLLDRIDIHVESTRGSYSSLSEKNSISTAEIKERVLAACNMQYKRYGTKNKYNAHLNVSEIEKYCKLDKTSDELLKQAFEKLKMSPRAYHKILKLARTIADLEESEKIGVMHLTDALNYRSLDRKYFNL